MKSQYRVLEKGGGFWPQFKRFGIWWHFWKWYYDWDCGYHARVGFCTKLEADKYIEERVALKSPAIVHAHE